MRRGRANRIRRWGRTEGTADDRIRKVILRGKSPKDLLDLKTAPGNRFIYQPWIQDATVNAMKSGQGIYNNEKITV